MSGKLKLVTVDSSNADLLYENLSQIVSTAATTKNYYAEMLELCRKHKGVGLAANQVGLRENLFFIAASAKLLPCPGGHLCINPTWEPHKDAKQYTAPGEGCLSLPDKTDLGTGTRRFNVTRWNKIMATWTNTQGMQVKPRLLSGRAAQVFQHEHDHLRGILLVDSGEEVSML